MAYGKVGTGVSNVYAAIYKNAEGVTTYSQGQRLGRLVSAGYDVETTDQDPFHADNQVAETQPVLFASGTLNITVDGMFNPIKAFILGLPAADEDGTIHHNDDQNTPNLGVGYINEDMSDGVFSYQPILVPKVKFGEPSISHETRGESIDWQTCELEGEIMRDDTAKHEWLTEGPSFATLAEADTWLKGKLNIAS